MTPLRHEYTDLESLDASTSTVVVLILLILIIVLSYVIGVPKIRKDTNAEASLEQTLNSMETRIPQESPTYPEPGTLAY